MELTYEEKCENIRKENEHMLDLFEESLQGLKPQTIRKHLANVDLYINDYLLYEDAQSFEDKIGFSISKYYNKGRIAGMAGDMRRI